MKKLTFVVSIVALSMAACSKEQATDAAQSTADKANQAAKVVSDKTRVAADRASKTAAEVRDATRKLGDDAKKAATKATN